MRLLKCAVTNFGSYPHFEIDFSNVGLGLIYGRTGSGKSTIPDMPCWALFGQTAKDGAVDEVRAWQSPDKATTAELQIELQNDILTIVRIRGRPSENDLYWIENDSGTETRGKDIVETQKLLEKRIGVSSELYLTGAYFHEFSGTGSFFTAKAKDRRTIFERIASLELAAKLASGASEQRKSTKKALEETNLLVAKNTGRLEQLDQTRSALLTDIDIWNTTQKNTLQSLKASYNSFDATKAKNIEVLAARHQQFESDKTAKTDELIGEIEKLDAAVKPVRYFEKQMLKHVEQNQELENTKAERNKGFSLLCEVKAKLDSVKYEHKRYSETKGGTCPVCLGPSENANKAEHLAKLTSAIKDMEGSLTARTCAVAELEEKIRLGAKITDEMHNIKAAKVENSTLLDKREALRQRLGEVQEQTSPYPEQIEQAKNAANPYAEQYQAASAMQNPYTAKYESLCEQFELSVTTVDAHKRAVSQLEHRTASLTRLYDLSSDLRGELLKKSIQEIETSTNQYLETYFDAEIKVSFSLEGADNLEVAIQKNGYDCVYRQLSKGQRQLLKLSFVISVMNAASNKAGVHFANLFFDEALDGLDTDLKIKAFGLFQELEASHESIFVVEHSPDFQNLFSKRYHVTMIADASEMKEENEQ